MAKHRASVDRFKRVEQAMRDCSAAARRLRDEAEAAAGSANRTEAERAALSDIAAHAADLAGPLGKAHGRLIDVTSPA